MTRRTLSEIAATCTKAARGAGCPWGMAEEAGLAARLLSAHGLRGAEAVAHLLETPRACRCSGAPDAPTCGLVEMTGLLDAPPVSEVAFPSIAGPTLVVAFALADGGYWRVEWPGGAALCGPDGLSLSGRLPDGTATVTIRPATPFDADRPADCRSGPVDSSAWEALEALAARTLVPETPESRAAGAGPDS